MNILAVDTALGACSVAITVGGRIRAHTYREMVRGHAEALAPMVEAAMGEAGCAFAQLDRLGVTTGPGTFTGQRVGLAFIRAMALALNIPPIGVTTLDAMIEAALDEDDAPWAVTAIDAKRGEVYLGARGANGNVLIEPVLMSVRCAAGQLVERARAAGPDFLCAGTGAELLLPELAAKGLKARLSAVRQPDAAFVARLALRATPSGAPPRPLYLRAPDAKLPATGLSGRR